MSPTPAARRLTAILSVLVVTLAGALTVGAQPAVAAQRTSVSIDVNSSTVRTTELVFVRGRVTRPGGPAARAKVKIQARKPGGRFRTIAWKTAGRKGRFTIAYRPGGTRVYRAVVVRTSRYRASVSDRERASRTTRPRSYPARQRALAFKLGRPTRAVRTTRRFGQRVVHGSYRGGFLAQVGSNTSIVYGRILDRYQAVGGVAGRLGAPIADGTCQLYERACLQRFQNGTIYLNRRARHPVRIVYGSGPKTAFMAAALSQAGYREPSYRGGKFNRWQGNRNAWCGFFLAWASRASGNGNAFPRAGVFSKQVAEVRRRGGLFHRPKVGAAAFIDYFGNGRPTHVALVVGVTRDGRIRTVEGNVDSRGRTGHPRGVFRLTRSTKRVLFYANPRY